MFTNTNLVAFALNAVKVGAKYWYGTYGQTATQSLLNSKANQYPDHYGSSRMATYKQHIADDRMVCDCVGLWKSFFWSENGTREPKYATNGCPDTNADGMFKLCKESGAIKTLPEIPGLVLWSSGHIGVYVGNGYAVEARGFAYGVVKTKVTERSWTNWGKLPMLTYETSSTPAQEPSTSADSSTDSGAKNPYTEPTANLKKGSKGTGVKWVQWALVNAGYGIGKCGIDGDFGGDTNTAVRKYQTANKLEVDGIVGPNTRAALKATASGGGATATTPAVNGQIIDIAEYQGNVNWDKLAPEVSLVILRCGVTEKATMKPAIDEKVKEYAGECTKRGIPFGVYYFGRAGTANLANQEAEAAYSYACAYNPLFWVYDAEDERITKASAKAFIERIRLLGAKKVGYYIAHHLYNTYKLDTSAVDFVWIPRYGANDGQMGKAPDFPCDLHQYTSTGKVAGISSNVDLSVLTGSKPLSWFLGR